MNKVYSFLILLLLATTISCSTRPIGLIEERKMGQIMEDFYKAEAIFKKDSKNYKTYDQKDALIASILSKYDVTQEQLDKSLAWYVDNMDVYGAVQDSVSARIERKSASLNQAYDNLYKKNKLFNLSTDFPNVFVIDNTVLTFGFNLDSVKLQSFEKDRLMFQFRTQGVDTLFHDLESGVYYKYKDTIIVEKLKIKTDNQYTFTPPTGLSIGELRGVSGYVHLSKKEQNVPRIILYNLINKEPLDPKMDSLLNALKQI